MRIALCHAWKMAGFALIVTMYLLLIDDTGFPVEETLKKFYQIIGYIIICSSAIFIILMALNEFRQRQGLIYNYRDCLDHDNAIANNYCKLFSKNEVIIERNPTVSAAGMWKSSENLLPRNKKNYTNLWTLYMMLPKLHGAVMFHYFLVTMTLASSSGYINWSYSQGIVVWTMAFGAILGCVLLRFVHCGNLFTLTSTAAVITIGVSFIFNRNNDDVISICFFIYFFAVSLASAIPDLALMEIAKIRFIEGALALGYFLEIIPIAVLQSTQRDAYLLTRTIWYTDKYFMPVAVSTIVILVITSLLYQLHMPNTFNKSLLQIQNELLKFKQYFAFDFDNEVTSATSRTPSESIPYLADSSVNVFEDHEKNVSRLRTYSSPNDYVEVMDKLPDPPVNNIKHFNYNTDIPKAPAIIPRVNIGKSSQKSSYGPK